MTPPGVELRSKILARLDRERKSADGTPTGPGPWARLTIRVAESGYLAEPMPDSGALPRFKLIPGADFPRRNIFCKIRCNCKIFPQISGSSLQRFAAGIINVGPGAIALRNQIADQNAGNRSMGHALAGIARDHVSAPASWIAPDKAGEVDRILDLARPAMQFPAKIRQKVSHKVRK